MYFCPHRYKSLRIISANIHLLLIHNCLQKDKHFIRAISDRCCYNFGDTSPLKLGPSYKAWGFWTYLGLHYKPRSWGNPHRRNRRRSATAAAGLEYVQRKVSKNPVFSPITHTSPPKIYQYYISSIRLPFIALKQVIT